MNYLSIFIATIVGFSIGALWYSPVLFGTAWMKAMGFTKSHMKADKKKGMTWRFITMFIGLLTLTSTQAYFLQWATSLSQGLVFSFWLWLGFIATTMIGSILWEGKKSIVYFINIAHYLVVLIINAVILSMWA